MIVRCASITSSIEFFNLDAKYIRSLKSDWNKVWFIVTLSSSDTCDVKDEFSKSVGLYPSSSDAALLAEVIIPVGSVIKTRSFVLSKTIFESWLFRSS